MSIGSIGSAVPPIGYLPPNNDIPQVEPAPPPAPPVVDSTAVEETLMQKPEEITTPKKDIMEAIYVGQNHQELFDIYVNNSTTSEAESSTVSSTTEASSSVTPEPTPVKNEVKQAIDEYQALQPVETAPRSSAGVSVVETDSTAAAPEPQPSVDTEA